MGEAIETGSGEGLVKEVRSMYMQCDPSVKMGEKHSKRFNVDWGMRQIVVSHHGCVMCSSTT